MTGYDARYSDDPAAREFIDRLVDAGQTLPDRLHDQILEAGDEAARALIRLVEDRELTLASAPGGGYVGIHAVQLLGEREQLDAIEPLIELVEWTRPEEIIYSTALKALSQIGQPVVEPILEAIERGVEEDTRNGLAGVLARVGERDERIYETLLDVFEDQPGFGASYLADYGDPRAVESLSETLDAIQPAEFENPLIAIDIVIETAAAIERLGHTLSGDQQRKVDRAVRERRSAMEQLTDRRQQTEQPYELTDEQRQKAKKRLARRRRRVRGPAKRKLKKAAKYGRYRIAKSLVNSDWKESRLANLIQTRRTPAGSIVFSALLVDLGCLGPKDAVLRTDLSETDVENTLANESGDFTSCNPHLTAKIAREGALLAAFLELPISGEAFAVMRLFERYDPERSDEEIPLGRYGKPHFMPGPHDDVDAIVDHLDEQLGEDGYDVELPPWM